MADYHYWKKVDQVGLVISNNNWNGSFVGPDGQTYPKAYLVDPEDKKQVEAARNWAKNHNDPTIPEMIVLDNEGFTIQIADAANGSSQGGKLSFWTCLVSKEDVGPYAIGINSDLLCDLIIHSNMQEGKCSVPVSFARKNGQVGVLHPGMPAYEEMMADMERKNSMNSGKTSKWIPGSVYETATKRELYLGNFQKCLSVSYDRYLRPGEPINVTLDLKVEAKPVLLHMYDEYREMNLDQILTETYDDGYSGGLCFIDKLPSRKKGMEVFENTPENREAILDHLRESGANCIKTYNMRHSLGKIFAGASDYDKTIEALKKLRHNIEEDIKLVRNGRPTIHFMDYNENSIGRRIAKCYQKEFLKSMLDTKFILHVQPSETVYRLVGYVELVKMFEDILEKQKEMNKNRDEEEEDYER